MPNCSPLTVTEAKNFPAEFKDPNDYWCAVYVVYRTIGYNSKLVAQKDLPRQWEDLLDAKMGKASFQSIRRVTTLTPG